MAVGRALLGRAAVAGLKVSEDKRKLALRILAPAVPIRVAQGHSKGKHPDMALSTHAGGAADKAGFIHEALWGMHGFLAVLNGDASAIRIETPGEDGAEFYLERPTGLEHWQAKRQVTGQDTWSIQKLKDVLAYFLEKFRKGERCVFASVSDAPDLRMLTENARAAASLEEFKAKFLDKKRTAQFIELAKSLGIASDEETFGFLRSISLEGGREITLESFIGYALRATFQGHWQTTFALLRDLYLRSSHERLTAADIERYLHGLGVERRRAGAPGARDHIKATTLAYLAGQRAKLISGTPIHRSAGDEVIAKLRQNASSVDILITSPAGGGKSACLAQIVEGLQEANIPVLAFRLDRIEPVSSPILLGDKLGLGESPAVVLADLFPGQPVVLVIDQLDFVSTTSGRHPDFFDTVAALRDEILGLRQRGHIHLIMACRKFDFEHDHRLKQLAQKGQAPIELREFTMEEVRKVVSEQGGDLATLTPHQQRMLCLPQNLSLFVEAKLTRTNNRFTTSKDLCDAYWSEKRKRVSEHRSDFGQLWMPAIQRLAGTMSERQELSVSFREMDAFPPEFLEKMASEGVLTWDGKRYGFGHETFFDYCFARTLPNGGRDFVPSLEVDEQHLFRRAQVRQVLAFLRDDDFDGYLATLDYLLRSERIRAHLKILCVELVAAASEPHEKELQLLLPWIEGELAARRSQRPNLDKLGSRIFDAFFGSRSLFPLADRLGLIERWLASGEPWLRDTTVLYLRWQVEQYGDRIVELLEPFAERPEWRDRLRYMMEGRNLEKSRRYFEFFLRLLADGTLDEARDRFASNGTFWSMLHGLAEERPAWCAELAGAWLDRQMARTNATASEGESVRDALSDSFGVDDLFQSARGDPRAFLNFVLPAVLRAAKASTYSAEGERLSRDKLWLIRFRGEVLGMQQAYLTACENALSTVGSASPAELRPLIDRLRAEHLHTANTLLLTAYASNPAVFADEALTLLAEEPDRLSCGHSGSLYWTARQLIAACSPHCSEETFQKLEATLLAFVPPYERTKDGMRFRGHAAFNFASALPLERLSTDARRQVAEWKEKFKEPDGPPIGIRSYTVGSPIEEEAATHMTDQQWLGAIAKYDTEDRRYSFDHPERGGALELARMLQKFTEQQPARFAELALQLPPQTHPYYFSHVLHGLKASAIPFDLKLAVTRRVFDLDQYDCVHAALELLATVGEASLPEDAVTFIERSAEHPNPEPEFWNKEDGPFGGDILMQGINCIRGQVAETIRELLWSDASYLGTFAPTIQKLVRDSSLAVRTCAATTLLAVDRHNPELALTLAMELLDADERLLGTDYVVHLIHNGIRRDLEPFCSVIRRMLRSDNKKVTGAGGRLACLAALYHESGRDLAEAALTSAEACRQGACDVAKSNLLHVECRAWCEDVLVRLFNDESASVRRDAAGCFWHLWRSPETPLASFDALIRAFLESPAFAEEPTYLLHALEETKHKVPEATLDVCEAFIRHCAAAARDIRTSIAGDERTIGKLVFTAYAQLQAQTLQRRALDVIDAMNIEGLTSARQHLVEFER